MLLDPGDVQGYVPRPAAWTNFMGSTAPNDPYGPGVFPTIKRLNPWSMHKDSGGSTYYFNQETGETTWNQPEDFKSTFNQHQVHINKIKTNKNGSMTCIRQHSSCQWRFMF